MNFLKHPSIVLSCSFSQYCFHVNTQSWHTLNYSLQHTVWEQGIFSIRQFPNLCLTALFQFHVSLSCPSSMSQCLVLVPCLTVLSFFTCECQAQVLCITVLSQFHVWPFFSNFMFNCHMTQCQILPQVKGHIYMYIYSCL